MVVKVVSTELGGLLAQASLLPLRKLIIQSKVSTEQVFLPFNDNWSKRGAIWAGGSLIFKVPGDSTLSKQGENNVTCLFAVQSAISTSNVGR